MALGILCAYGVLSRLGRARGLSPDRLANLVVLLVFTGLAGARLFFVAEHWPYFRADPAAIVRIWEGGLMFYGSIVIAGLVLVAYCARARLRMLPLLDLFAVVVPVGQAFGRVGCFLNGCCYGRPADTWLSVRYPALSIPWHDQVNAGLLPAGAPASLPMLPSQLIEAAGCALLFLLLLWAYRRLNPAGVPVAEPPAPGARDPAGAALAIYLAGYGVLRFIVETLRSDERAHPFGGPFTISQAISLGALLLAAALFARIWLRNRPSARA